MNIEKQKKEFTLDPQLSSTCIELGNWSLSRILLKNNSQYPWLILVPRKENLREVDDLPQQSRYQLMDELSALSTIVRTYFKPDKLNVAYLGNIVAQLHIHVVGRFIKDPLWPHGIWQAAQSAIPYENKILNPLVDELRLLIQHETLA